MNQSCRAGLWIKRGELSFAPRWPLLEFLFPGPLLTPVVLLFMCCWKTVLFGDMSLLTPSKLTLVGASGLCGRKSKTDLLFHIRLTYALTWMTVRQILES